MMLEMHLVLANMKLAQIKANNMYTEKSTEKNMFHTAIRKFTNQIIIYTSVQKNHIKSERIILQNVRDSTMWHLILDVVHSHQQRKAYFMFCQYLAFFIILYLSNPNLRLFFLQTIWRPFISLSFWIFSRTYICQSYI